MYVDGRVWLGGSFLVALMTVVGQSAETEPVFPAPETGVSAAGAETFAALKPWGSPRDGVLSIGYFQFTGEIWIDARGGQRLTSINIESDAGIFTGDPPLNLEGRLDHSSDHHLFKTTPESSFGSLSFGSVAKRNLGWRFLLDDLTVTGTLVDGSPLEDVDLIYIPEPSTWVLLGLGWWGLLTRAGRRRARAI